MKHFAVNGKANDTEDREGLRQAVTREWKAGDTPNWNYRSRRSGLRPTKNRGDSRSCGVALGPLIYNVERADQADLNQPLGDAPLPPEWKGICWAASWRSRARGRMASRWWRSRISRE